ncbi:MAG: tetratricopeptide repeat protein [Promethearchaeota archaeon]
MASNDDTGVVISIYLDNQDEEDYTVEDYREYFINKIGASSLPNFKTRERGEMTILEYTNSRKFEDFDFKQKHLNALMVKDGICIDIHLSKVGFEDEDMKLFHSVLDSINFIEKELSLPMKCLILGNKYFSESNYEEAIKYLSACLEKEAEQKTLPTMYIMIVIDNLGMAYGISGDLEMAKKTFELGLSIDPEYPMFYYNLACTYAEMNDLKNTISNLQMCYKYKDNMFGGEVLPDPRTDDSFERFLNNKKFQKVINKF